MAEPPHQTQDQGQTQAQAQLAVRRPYHGSCHCGHIRYIAYITVPTARVLEEGTASRTRFYKCNCSTCYKMGFFHMRLADPVNDFFVLSPLDIDSPVEMGDYLCGRRRVHWYFCPRCAVRCFTSDGSWKLDEASLDNVRLPGNFGTDISRSGKIHVLRMDTDALRPRQKIFLSVNALSVDQEQGDGENDPLDLRDIVDRKLVEYLDYKEGHRRVRVEYPHNRGTW